MRPVGARLSTSTLSLPPALTLDESVPEVPDDLRWNARLLANLAAGRPGGCGADPAMASRNVPLCPFLAHYLYGRPKHSRRLPVRM